MNELACTAELVLVLFIVTCTTVPVFRSFFLYDSYSCLLFNFCVLLFLFTGSRLMTKSLKSMVTVSLVSVKDMLQWYWKTPKEKSSKLTFCKPTPKAVINQKLNFFLYSPLDKVPGFFSRPFARLLLSFSLCSLCHFICKPFCELCSENQMNVKKGIFLT